MRDNLKKTYAYLDTAYGKNYIAVETKGGMLVAVPGGDPDYPAIHTFFLSFGSCAEQQLVCASSSYHFAAHTDTPQLEDGFHLDVARDGSYGEYVDRISIARINDENEAKEKK